MNFEIELEKGISLCRENRFEEAIVLFDKIIETTPNQPNALYNKAKALAKLEKQDESLSLFNKLITIHPSDAHFISERGILHFVMGQNENAIQEWTFFVPEGSQEDASNNISA